MTDYPEGYIFNGGYPTPETIRRAYDDADFNRAVQCYRFFYPTVSIMATWKGNIDNGVVPNKVFPLLEGTPHQLVFTPNSDTPYAAAALDLSDGPMVVALPPGPLMCTSNDLNQRWIMDMGLPGPDGGNGGKHVLCGPEFTGDVPPDHYKGTATTNRVLMLLRALPHGDDMQGAIDLMQSIKVHPLDPGAEPAQIEWVDLSKIVGADFTPVRWEDQLSYWEVLHELIDSEPPFAEYRTFYGELASLGIEKASHSSRTSGCGTSSPVQPSSGTPSSGCSRSLTGDEIVKCGRARPGNGPSCVRRTGPSMLTPTSTTTPARSGFIKPRLSLRPCSNEAPGPARSIG